MLYTYDWQGALDNCRDLLKRDPDHLGALEVSAQAQWFAGEYLEVIRTTTRLLKLNPLEPGYRYTRGMSYLSLGELHNAWGDFSDALAQSDDPRFCAQVHAALTAVEQWRQAGPNVVARRKAQSAASSLPPFGDPGTIIN